MSGRLLNDKWIPVTPCASEYLLQFCLDMSDHLVNNAYFDLD